MVIIDIETYDKDSCTMSYYYSDIDNPKNKYEKIFVLNPFTRSTKSGKNLFLRTAFRYRMPWYTTILSEQEYVWQLLNDE